jgi:hypothetical protein
VVSRILENLSTPGWDYTTTTTTTTNANNNNNNNNNNNKEVGCDVDLIHLASYGIAWHSLLAW